MNQVLPRVIAAAFLTVLGTSCSSSRSSATGGGVRMAPGTGVQPIGSGAVPAAIPRKLPHTAADVHFMSGMIPHHAQAVLIAGWAATHGARDDVKILSERIVVAQRDEIALMQRWLRDVGAPVPAADATHLRMTMDGMVHDMLMPGMLNAEELERLNRARGSEFDRLFLIAMIKHHEGAVSMVDELFGSPGAGQDEVVFRFASDVYADQTTEIDRMQKMLATIPSVGRIP
jgi:uncharacterized protein (DUF305 family)